MQSGSRTENVCVRIRDDYFNPGGDVIMQQGPGVDMFQCFTSGEMSSNNRLPGNTTAIYSFADN